MEEREREKERERAREREQQQQHKSSARYYGEEREKRERLICIKNKTSTDSLMVSCFLYIPDTLYLSLSLSPKVRAIQNRAGLFIHSGGGVVLGVVVVVLFGQKSQKVKSGGGSFSLSLSL